MLAGEVAKCSGMIWWTCVKCDGRFSRKFTPGELLPARATCPQCHATWFFPEWPMNDHGVELEPSVKGIHTLQTLLTCMGPLVKDR